MTKIDDTVSESPLGKTTTYPTQYSADLLFPIARESNRREIGVSNPLPFKGFDVWNAFELSWLNLKGKPVVAVAELRIPCDSPYLIESKSMKLYLNSFNQSKFHDVHEVHEIITHDLSKKTQSVVYVDIKMPEVFQNRFHSKCLDDLDVVCEKYHVEPSYLFCESDELIEEKLHSNLLKSNCMITGQPDWGSVEIHYYGKKINHEGLLKYIISFREHHEFHEPCVERIFMDIMKRCAPQKLTVQARYTRRGGIDINPYRSTENGIIFENLKHFRQ